jgi:diguanylate cyclase (GGDEF)-like protein/PAS domain S-box-containing protein
MTKRTIRITFIAFISFVAIGIITGTFTHRFLLQRLRSDEIARSQEVAGSIRARLEANLANDLLMIHSTAAYISVNSDVTEEEFQGFAKAVIRDSDTLSNLVAAPDLVIRYVFPLESNEAVLGIDYRDLPEQLPLVLAARDSGELVIAGPLDVVQGGQGILGRAPVYYERDGERVFWGIVSSLISFDRMIEGIKPILERNGLDLAVRGINGTGAEGAVFFGDEALFSDDMSILRDVSLPNGSWQIAVAPTDGWQQVHPYHRPIVGAIAVIVVFATILVYRRATIAHIIQKNEKRLADIAMASSDIIWETDRSGVYTYMSGRAKELLGYEPEDLIGRSIFTLVAPNNQEIATSFRTAIESHQPVYDSEVWLTRVDDEQVCVLRNAVPLYDERSRRLIGYRGVDKDISIRKRLQYEVEENAALLNLFFQQSLDGFFFMMLDEPIVWNGDVDKEAVLDYVFDHQRITKINDAMLDQYRAKRDDFIGMTPRDFFQHDIDAGRATWRRMFDEERLHVDTNEQRFDGTGVVIEGDYIVLKDSEGRITGHFGVQRDVTALRDAEAELQRYIKIVDENVIISQTDLDGLITYASDAFSKISGYSKKELLGENHNIIRHPDMPDKLFEELWDTILAGDTWHGEIKNRKKDGTYYWVDSDVSPLLDRYGVTYGYMAVRQDITAQKELEIVSVTDRLTGLFNRQKIDRVLEEERSRYSRYGEKYSIIILDIDHFKSINDTFGHLEGDRILKGVAEIVRTQIRQTDIPGRWGGEEFLVLCPHTETEGALARAEGLRHTIENFDFGLERPVTASFGVAQVPARPRSEGEEPAVLGEEFGDATGVTSHHEITEKLLRSADAALYQAKEGGRNRVVVWK